MRDGDSDIILLVRSYKNAQTYKEAYVHFLKSELKQGELTLGQDLRDPATYVVDDVHFQVECSGGGMIWIDDKNKDCDIYGHSLFFGQADHKLCETLIKKDRPELDVIKSN